MSPSRDIPFKKLVLSQSNVRCIKAGISVEKLAKDIARRCLLAVHEGWFEVPALLDRLVAQNFRSRWYSICP